MTGSAARILLVLATYMALAVAHFWSSWRSPAAQTIGGGPDIYYSIWFLRWVAYAVTHGVNPLLTTHLDYPAGVNLMWSGLFPLPAIVLTPVTLTFGPVVAYTALMTLAVGGSAFTAFLAIRRYVRHDGGAVLGGALYGFSPYMMAQSLGHPQAAIAILPPLLLMAIDQVVVRQRQPWVKTGLVLGLLAAAQLWTGEEMLATAVVVAVIGIALLAALHPGAARARAPYAAKAMGVAAASGLIAAGFPLAVQFLGPQRVSGSLQPLNIFVSDLFSFILPTRLQALAPSAALQFTDHFSGNLSEWNAYLGIPLLVLLAIIAAFAWQETTVRLWALLATVIAMLSLGITIHVGGSTTGVPVALLGLAFPRWRGAPWRTMLVTFVGMWAALPLMPLIHNILPNRLMLYVFLFAGILLARFVQWAASAGTVRARLLGGVAVAIALLVLVPSLPLTTIDARSPRFFTAGAADSLPPGETALVAPYSRVGYADAMLWQAASGMAFRMPEGYAFVPGPSPSPPATALGIRMVQIEMSGGSDVDEARRGEMLGNLHAWQVRTVIVGPMAHQSDMVDFFTHLLGESPIRQGGVYLFPDLTP